MLVDHVTFSKTGGAGEVASILATAQNSLGVDARLLNLVSGDLKSEPFTRPLITIAAALDEYMVSNHSSPTILSLFRSRLSQLSLKALRSESVVHLHWLPGVFAHEQVRKLLSEGRKVVWTLHDMAPFTGVCHHSHGCSGFQGDCSECPQVRNGFKKAVELNLTKKVFDRIEKNLILVAPTPWIAKQARASSVFKNQRIEVIENPIRDEFFQEQESASLHRQRPNSETPGQLVLTAVASDLSNPAKGIENIVDIYQRVREMNSSIRLNLIGRRGHQFNKPSLGIHWLGSLSAKEIIEVACQTSLLVSSSKAESAGLTVREFGALGVPSIAIRAGGIENLIEDGFSGFLVDDEAGLEQKLSDLATGRIKVSELGARALEISLNNKPEIIGQIYKDLYTSIH